MILAWRPWMKKFALIGAAGFVAPRHIQAIKNVGGDLITIMDPHDSVGIIDSYFPNAQYFSEFERFDRYCSKRSDIDYVSICSPNYLHDAHCRFSMRIGADAICEKPLVLKEKNLIELKKLEESTGKKVHTILQLRYNPILIKLKERFEHGLFNDENAFLRYYTPRGDWYHYSWKTNMEKSGGLITNIGIHLVDALCWMFGPCVEIRVSRSTDNTVSGHLHFKRITVNYTLSISQQFEPTRLLQIGNEKFELSGNFKDLHDKSYEHIVAGDSFGIEDVRESIRVCEEARKQCVK